MRVLLAVLALGLLGQDRPVRELIQRLEDDQAESRETAQKELRTLGEAALHGLRDVVESATASDELKLRAAAVIREIELAQKAAKVYREPRRVTFTGAGLPLRDVLAEIHRQTEAKIDAAAVDIDAKVAIDAKDAPLFEVLDQLCRDQADRSWESREDGSIRLNRERHPGSPAVYSGPFRVRVQSMNAQRNNDFKARTVVATATIQADWDQRLKPSKLVEIELQRAVDDQGTTLEVQAFEGNMVWRGGPGVQLRGGGGVTQDTMDNSRSFMFRNVHPAATTLELEGVARYSFPLDQREVKLENPAPTETRDIGDTTMRLAVAGTPENWVLSFHKAASASTPGWARTIGQRFDPNSFVVVDQDGNEHTGVMRPQQRGRMLQDETGVWYQALIQRPGGKAIRQVRFKFVDQTLSKPVPFKFTALALP